MKIYTDYKAEQFLSKYLPVAKNQLVKKLSQITIKTPLVLKIISDQALHKSDINGVRIIKNEDEIGYHFYDLIKISKERNLKLDGILAQEFHDGEQLIIGIKKDPVFNHVLVFGLGGIFTELLEDISIRKCPINLKDAEEMISELKAKKIFQGYRGKNLNTEELKKTLVKLSQIPLKHKNIQELDINPLILNSKHAIVVDARIIFN